MRFRGSLLKADLGVSRLSHKFLTDSIAKLLTTRDPKSRRLSAEPRVVSSAGFRLGCTKFSSIGIPSLTQHIKRDTLWQHAVIKSFADEATAQLFAGTCPRRWQYVRRSAERKLALLDAATSLEFLYSPPGNRLELLQGDRKGQHSIRINDQWRVCFTWKDGDAFDVAIIDYH